MQRRTVWQEVAQRVEAGCAERGCDLVQPLAVDWFNGVVSEEQRLPDFGRTECLALVIGNTRALWPPFVAALHDDAALRGDSNPIHRYAERSIGSVIEAAGHRFAVRWSHGPPPFVPMQRLAQIAGLAYLAPGRTCVHPRFGPWIGLRAVVVLDVEGPPGPPPRMVNPCDACPRACEPALLRAIAGGDDWRLWLAVRDACPLGVEHRYSEEQVHYHYTKDVDALRAAVFGRRGAP